MKRRADYILEKLNVKKIEQSHNKTRSSDDTKSLSSKKKYDGDSLGNSGKENVFSSLPSAENTSKPCSSPIDRILAKKNPDTEINATSPSIIENSPDRSISFDASKFPLYNQIADEVHTQNKTTTSVKSPDLVEKPPENTRDSSLSSSSSSSSSDSSSSSSRSSSSSSGHNSCNGAVIISNPQSDLHIDNPSTSGQVIGRSVCAKERENYYESPLHSNESDVDLSDSDPTYNVHRSRSRVRRNSQLSSSSTSSSSHRNDTASGNIKRSRKRLRNPSKWKQNIAKSHRNSGKPYISKSKKEIPARCIKEACKCRLKCPENVNETDRKQLFESYWSLGDIELQRSYIRSCMMEIKPKYRYSNAAKPRLPNNAFYFTVNHIKIRVCKTFFINTLGICDRQIRTVKKKTDPQGFIVKDNRGKHGARKPTDPLLIQDIKKHINSIPRIESHYLRASTSREYISGEKTIMDLWKDFDQDQREKGNMTCDYWLYYDIFTKEFNIGFFQPKKDRCDLCLEYELANSNRKTELKEKYEEHLKQKDLCLEYELANSNRKTELKEKYEEHLKQKDLCLEYELANSNRKTELKEKYEEHLKQKDLCRDEKRTDRQNIDDLHICAVYDLQAVMQCPTGETSSFFYKSKLNCLNFTIVQLSKKSDLNKKRKKNNEAQGDSDTDIGAYNKVYSYFWDETQAKRGANEIGSCVLDYLQNLNDQHPNKTLHVIFYSDNCCGQNKNKYITSLYSYAVARFENIHSITHKYLIKGHTQNEGDNVHSLIEKEIKKNKKSGPIYAPYQYVTLIKNSRKHGTPFIVKELTYDFFIDVKTLQEKWAYNFNEDEHKNIVQWNNVKALRFCKEEPFIFFYKTSYNQSEFTLVNMRNKRKKMIPAEEITTTKAFDQRLALSEHKKKDLRDLVNRNLIPNYYADFYSTIL